MALRELVNRAEVHVGLRLAAVTLFQAGGHGGHSEEVALELGLWERARRLARRLVEPQRLFAVDDAVLDELQRAHAARGVGGAEPLLHRLAQPRHALGRGARLVEEVLEHRRRVVRDIAELQQDRPNLLEGLALLVLPAAVQRAALGRAVAHVRCRLHLERRHRHIWTALAYRRTVGSAAPCLCL